MKNEKLVLSERLGDVMSDKNITAKELSKKSGLSTSMISALLNPENHEKGGRNIGIDKLILLCEHLDVSADYLLGLSKLKSVDVNIQTIQKATGISEIAAAKLARNALGYWVALDSVLASDTFWRMLIMMELYKKSFANDQDGEYITSRIVESLNLIMPVEERGTILKEDFFKTIFSHYCWELAQEYKKQGEE